MEEDNTLMEQEEQGGSHRGNTSDSADDIGQPPDKPTPFGLL